MGMQAGLTHGPNDYSLSVLGAEALEEELAAAWEIAKHEPPSPATGSAWDESTWAHWRYVIGLESAAATEAARDERERRRQADWYEKVRRHKVAVWHSTWATTPVEERRRQIVEAWAEVGKLPPEDDLKTWRELRAGRD